MTKKLQKWIVDDLDKLIGALPQRVQASLRKRDDLSDLLEVVLDLGRQPEARLPNKNVYLHSDEVTDGELQSVVTNIGSFGDDNRAGIERTLHRISAIRNRSGKIVGLTCRVGRAVFGTGLVIHDLVSSGKSILLLGRPGVGKTTMLRELARVLADDANKRVVVVDTSNEVAGDGDIPHTSIGKARRMQVATPALQHSVMIEAVENHMPEVIIIDEMGTELEAAAARTIAERGVQLIATAHGNTLDNLIMNPTLSDLVGGVQPVTLGDEEAKRRRTQKTILERKSPPTFEVLVEIQNWDQIAVHRDVAQTVDRMLRGYLVSPEIRCLGRDDSLQKTIQHIPSAMEMVDGLSVVDEDGHRPRVHPVGVNNDRLRKISRGSNLPVEVVSTLDEADTLLTTKSHYRRRSQILRSAEERGIPVFVLRKNTTIQIENFLRFVAKGKGGRVRAGVEEAVREAVAGAEHVVQNGELVGLSVQNSYVRRLQHDIAGRYQLHSRSNGREPRRRVTIFR